MNNLFKTLPLQTHTESAAPVNSHWLAFFREARRLAELARQREAEAQASAGPKPTFDPSGKYRDATTTIDKEKAPAPTGAIANPLDS